MKRPRRKFGSHALGKMDKRLDRQSGYFICCSWRRRRVQEEERLLVKAKLNEFFLCSLSVMRALFHQRNSGAAGSKGYSCDKAIYSSAKLMPSFTEDGESLILMPSDLRVLSS